MVKYMTTEHPLSGITVYTSAPWVIYVQPLDDFERQMANLKAVLKTNVPSEYVDLRFGDRVYWK
ncbi:hypothetical protein KKA13_00205, partial [Patescibacteria group bacterium]|nr:hypothetical protein [Patescibacteria group bacterium]